MQHDYVAEIVHTSMALITLMVLARIIWTWSI